ncbi:MAG: HAD-IG family 5'-nucleotidase [Myxococcales bacterium]|nr:HAD-IG family 5'-nucleotidase [Myxococcales bacterium]
MVAPGSELDPHLSALVGDTSSESDVPRRNRVFCNRNLRMNQIEMIGFDMDYTLALYHQAKLEELSIELTLGKLIDKWGYPTEIKGLTYDPQWAIRGLMVDRQLGNVFKMDRHSYVGRCYHGYRRLTVDERRAAYGNEKINLSSDRYEWIDTLFGLPEVVMYIAMVDWTDRHGPGSGLPPYDRLFGDIRTAIDEAHRDDTLKSVIKSKLPDYIVKDPMLAETLHKLRSAGKKLFVLTNSLWDYTDAVMSYLLDGERKASSWRSYFDYIIVGGNKPAFFNEQRTFAVVDPATNKLVPGEVKQLSRDKVYQGGNVMDFEAMTQIRGDRVLYIGDHIYGDILRLRKHHMWRTAMVLQELEREIAVADRLEAQIRDLDLLDRRHRNLESEIDYQVMRQKKIQRLLDEDATNPAMRSKLEEAKRSTRAVLESWRDRASLMNAEVDALEAKVDRTYNPYWGSCLREGNENSRFGEQVNDYADLYTSRVSNVGHYSPLRYFRAPRRPMPHEI